MGRFQEVATCLGCGTRLTVSGQGRSRSGPAAACRVRCPVCAEEVPIRIPSRVDPPGVCLIGYERPRVSDDGRDVP